LDRPGTIEKDWTTMSSMFRWGLHLAGEEVTTMVSRLDRSGWAVVVSVVVPVVVPVTVNPPLVVNSPLVLNPSAVSEDMVATIVLG
jgi:hypothetical protein